MAYKYLVEEIKQEIYKALLKDRESQTTENLSLKKVHSKTSIIYQVAQKYQSMILTLEKKQVYQFCEELLKDGSPELQLIAISWINSLRHLSDPTDFVDYQSWAEEHIHEKTACDDFGLSVMGPFLVANPMFLPDVLKWTFSPRWQMRRLAAATMIYCIRRRLYYRAMFETANLLRNDERCEVREGFRWLLREAKKICPLSVANYVRVHEKEIPPLFQKEMSESRDSELRS